MQAVARLDFKYLDELRRQNLEHRIGIAFSEQLVVLFQLAHVGGERAGGEIDFDEPLPAAGHQGLADFAAGDISCRIDPGLAVRRQMIAFHRDGLVAALAQIAEQQRLERAQLGLDLLQPVVELALFDGESDKAREGAVFGAVSLGVLGAAMAIGPDSFSF